MKPAIFALLALLLIAIAHEVEYRDGVEFAALEITER